MAAHLPLVALGRGPAGADIEANLGVLDRAGGLVARAGRSSATSASRPLEHAKEGHFLEEIGMKLWTLKGSQPQAEDAVEVVTVRLWWDYWWHNCRLSRHWRCGHWDYWGPSGRLCPLAT